VHQHTVAGAQSLSDLRGKRQESRAIVGNSVVGNREGLDDTGHGVRFEGHRIGGRLRPDLSHLRECDEGLNIVSSNLGPHVLEGLSSARHAVEEQTPRNAERKLDASKHTFDLVDNLRRHVQPTIRS